MATQRQRKAIENAVENGGNVSRAMRAAGYSPKTAKNPKKLTESKSWEQLMDELLPDKVLLQALSDDIGAKPGDRKPELELAFKVKGKLREGAKITDPAGRTLYLVNMEPEDAASGDGRQTL
jgi:hypothetical protein